MKVEIQTVGIYKKVNPIHDPEGRRRIKIGERFQVVALVNEGMASNGMWSRLTHAARFTSKAAVEALAARVRLKTKAEYRKGNYDPFAGIDLTNWTWSPSPCCPFAALQNAPTATEYDVG